MTITLTDFQDRGACRDHDPELFFPMSEVEAHEGQIEQAKAVCMSCPVLADCRAYALANPVEGIWGGMTEGERRVVRARDQKRERELAAAQATDEQLAGEDDQPEESAAPALPSYQTARARLTKARRALTLAQNDGDADAISRAEQRLEAAEQWFAAARGHREPMNQAAGDGLNGEQLVDDAATASQHQTDNEKSATRQRTDRERAYRAARNQLTRARNRLQVVQQTGDNVAIREAKQRIAAAERRVEATKIGGRRTTHRAADEAVA